MGPSFTEKTKKVLDHAAAYAEELGQGYIGTEHILLGLAKEPESVAQTILTNYGIDVDLVYDLAKEYTAADTKQNLVAEAFSPRAKRALKLAQMAAVELGHRHVGTEHILLGILREGESVAARLIASIGVDANRMYTEIVDQFEQMGKLPLAANGASSYAKMEGKILSQFGQDLTELAHKGALDPVVGREDEISRVIQILSRRMKNNPVLIGEPGVGKTAIAEGLAQKIIAGQVPEDLRGKRIVTLDLSGMLAGTKYRGDFEERIRGCMEEVKKAGDIILFIDELHTIIGAGAAEGAMDAANIVKPALGRGEMQIIGATTLDEYRKHIEKDAALERRFQPVTVDEPSEEDAIKILKGVREKYEVHHKLNITDEAIDAAVTLSARYITDRFLPDKAIDLMDEASSRVKMQSRTQPEDFREIEGKIETLRREKDEAILHQNFEKAALLRDEEKSLELLLEEKQKAWETEHATAEKKVTAEDIAAVISAWTGVPVTSLTEDENTRLLNMEQSIHARVVGQEKAVEAVSRAVRRGRVGLKDPKRPTGSFLFLGPTGVGKTELCKALAEAVFGDENAMIRVDMSEFMEKHTVSKLIGSPPGYIGYDEGGQLTEKIRRRPYSVILFDEIEKGHEDVFNILLQMLEDGHLTDGQGRKVDVKNAIIIMTSNIGARNITEKRKQLGFSADAETEMRDFEDIQAAVLGELKKAFRPEFLNRIDETIVFHPLTQAEIEVIAGKMLEGLNERLQAMELTLDVDEAALSYLAREGYDPIYGARPLRRKIQAEVEDKVAELLLQGDVKSGDKLSLQATEEKLDILVNREAAVV